MKLSEKKDFVKKMKDEFDKSTSVIVAHYYGLSVLETDSIRKEMRSNGAKFKVTKKKTYWRETISMWLVSQVIFYSWSF